MSHTLSNSKRLTTTPVALYEGNYRRIMRLFPELRELNKGYVVDNLSEELNLIILEQHKYTTMVSLTHQLRSAHSFAKITMDLRGCHDAGLLEVIAYQGQSQLYSIHAYPNKHMLQTDEKRQINLFLRDLLEHAIKSGLTHRLSTMP